jgi:hypothetical protein
MGREGWKGYWEKTWHAQLEKSRHEYVSPYKITNYYALLGDKENTFRYLDQAYGIHDVALTDIKTERNFNLLGADPRYATLLRRMGLAQLNLLAVRQQVFTLEVSGVSRRRQLSKIGCDFAAPAALYIRSLVDVVLLPVEGGVGLDDDVFVRSLLQFVHEQGLAGL